MILDHALRPIEMFDPSNKKHRQHYANYLKKGTWGHCPIRFAADNESANNNLAYAMQRMLVDYYMSKEFQVQAQDVK